MINYLEEGKSLHNQKNYKEALLNFEKALSLNSCEKGVHFEIGKTYYVQGKYAAAIAEFKKEISINPGFPYTYLLLAKVYKKQGKFDEAIKAFDKAVELGGADKEIARANSEKAGIYLEQKKYDLAIKEINKVIKLGFDNINAYISLGRIYLRKKEYEKALAECNKLLKISKGSKEVESRVYNEIAEVYLEQEKYDLAIQEAGKAIECDRNNGYAYKTLGSIHRLRKEYEEALNEFDKSFELSKGNKEKSSEIFIEKARVYLDEKSLEDAVSTLKKALELNPSNVKAHLFLAKAYVMQIRYDEALKEYGVVIGLNTGDENTQREVYEDRVQIYGQIGEYVKMAEEVNRLIGIGFSNTLNYVSLSTAYKMQGLYEEAEKAFNTALAMIKEEKGVEIKSSGVSLKKSRKEENRVLNEEEIVRGKTRLKSKVRCLGVALTNRCNLNCKMCFIQKKINPVMSGKVKDEIIAAFPYLEKITWMGGEVFLDPDFNTMLDESLKYKGIAQNITTNGLMLTEEIIKKFIKNGIKLGISIDGTTKEVYESIRRGARYEDIIEKLNMINRIKKQFNPGYVINLNIVVMKSNYRQIESFPEFAREHNFSNLNYVMIAENRNNENIFNFNRDKNILSYIDRALDKARERCDKYGINFSNNITKRVLDSGHKVRDDVPAQYNGKSLKSNDIKEKCYIEDNRVKCTAPWKTLNIGTQGEVIPNICCFCKYVVGNLNTQSMEEIWNGENMINYRKKILSGDIETVCTLKDVYKEIPCELLR